MLLSVPVPRRRRASICISDDAVPRLELFPFRYRNQVTGKWVRARYVASPE